MTISTATISGTLVLPDDTALSTVDRIEFTLTSFETEDATILPEIISADVDENGDFSIDIWPNETGVRGTQYQVNVIVSMNDGQYERRVSLGNISVPAATTYDLDDLLGASGYALVGTGIDAVASALLARKWASESEDTVVADGEYSAKHYSEKAKASSDKAEQWAEEAEDVSVESGQYSAKHHALKSAASANASATSALAAAAHENGAETARDATFVARDQARAAAQAASYDASYMTKALANIDLVNRSNGDVILVFEDESRGGRTSVYTVSGGAYVFVLFWPNKKTVFLSPDNGSDSNSGLAPDDAVASLAVAVGSMAKGDTLLIEGGTRIHGRLNGLPDYATVGRYGSGEDPIFDQSRPISAGSWTAHATVSGVWYADVTHEVATVNDGVESSDTKYCMWAEWDISGQREADLVPYWSGADIAANVAYIATQEHVFTCHVQGSTTKDPRLDVNTTTYRYYVYPPNGEDPSAGEITYYYGEYEQVASLPKGGVARDMIWQRSAAKDTSGHNANLAERLERIRIYGASGHAWVGGAMLVRDCYAKARRAGEDFSGAASGWHMFLGSGSGVANLERCEADGFSLNYYVHASGSADSHDVIRLKDCISRNALDYAIQHGDNILNGTVIDGFQSIDDQNFCVVDDGTAIRNSTIMVNENLIGYSGPTGGSVTVENCTLISKNGNKLAWNEKAQVLTDAAHRCTFVFRNCTNVGGLLTNATYWRLCHYEFYDCVLGQVLNATATFPGTLPWASIIADNTQLQIIWNSIEEIQALSGASGVASSCVVPTVLQTLTKAVSTANLTRPTKASRSVSGTSGDNTITANFQDWAEVNGEITILDYDGAGGTWTARITAINSTGSGGTIEVSPAPDATFSGKSFQLSNWGEIVWPSGDTGITAVFSDDGTQAYFSDVSGISVGTWVWFGGLNRRENMGPRKVTALTGQTATLDRAVTWWRKNTNHADLNYAAFGGSGLPRPSFAVQFGFPLRGEPNGATQNLGPTYEITHVSPASGTTSGTENGSTGGVARFQGGSPYLGADGTTRNQGQILHELGYLDAGFHPIGEGDSIEITAVVFVDEFTPDFAADPLRSGQAHLMPGSYLAGLGLGVKA